MLCNIDEEKNDTSMHLAGSIFIAINLIFLEKG
jgi:hypothetical protein